MVLDLPLNRFVTGSKGFPSEAYPFTPSACQLRCHKADWRAVGFGLENHISVKERLFSAKARQSGMGYSTAPKPVHAAGFRLSRQNNLRSGVQRAPVFNRPQ